MKILHINTLMEGGAAWCARRISNALIEQGVESRMLFAKGSVRTNALSLVDPVQSRLECENWIIAEKDKDFWYSNPILGKVKHLMMRIPWYIDQEKLQIMLDRIKKNLSLSISLNQPLSDYKNICNHPWIEWADIIHLHWVPDFVDYPTFFKNVKKPIVWTLHDMYPAIGVMHFESEFSVRPKELDKIDSYCRKIKKKALLKAQNIHLVAISEKMYDIIQSSDILNDFPVTLINNGVNTEVFKPINQESVVSSFLNTLKTTTKVFLFSSYSVWDKRKGLDRVLSAMEIIKEETNVDIALIAIGGKYETKQIPEVSFPICFVGQINDQYEMAKIYTAADFFVNASYEEAFAQTPLEAMACGTPVVSTPCSGSSDLVRPFCGIICEGFDSDDIADGIKKALKTQYISSSIRDYILSNYKYSIIANKYIEMYKSVLNV